jgi:hypothetical protein
MPDVTGLFIGREEGVIVDALSHFRGDRSKSRHTLDDKEPVIQNEETVLTEVMRTFLSSTTKYFDLLEASVCTPVNESVNTKRSRLASLNFAWADSWVARIALAVLNFSGPYIYSTELVQKIGFDLLHTYYQSLPEFFSQSIKRRQHPTGKRNRKGFMGKGSRASLKRARLAPHPPATLGSSAIERDNFFPCLSTESNDDHLERAE